MNTSINLNGIWQLTWAEGEGLMSVGHLTGENLGTRFSLPATVPAPIHRVLMDAGLLDDIYHGLNALRARWVEEAFWVYRRTFSVPSDAATATARLRFECLELDAAIYLNGKLLGVHRNAHRPAIFDVTGLLLEGENLLVVRLESGIHSNSDKQGSNYGTGEIGHVTKRHWNRHAQYQHGWDWQARLVNIGILGNVTLEWHTGLRMDDVTVFAVPFTDLHSATVTVRATVSGCHDRESAGIFRATLRETGQMVECSVHRLPGDAARVELTIPLTEPQLWWPAGYGEPFLYHVDVELANDGQAVDQACRVTRRTGVRRVEMDQSPHPVEGNQCILRVNNTPVFCKGANWVPADLLYSEVGAEKYRRLAGLALEANFNMLRIWGGGIFAHEALCDFCDEHGIMLWHDFLFACAKYPMQDPEFAAEVDREIRHATRTLAHHPSILVWCGNNEIETADWNWGYGKVQPACPHYALFHRDIPRMLKEEDPSKLHWISSPWSPDYENPDSETSGDQHPWSPSLFVSGGVDFHKYRQRVDRFANEGGVLGAVSPATLRQFLPESERRLLSPSWDFHDNTAAAQGGKPGEPGIAYETVSLWTGSNAMEMPWEDYAFASALLQAEALGEFILNYRRRMFSSAAAVFWMFNDSWPATHSWTIVDYYERRKLAFCPVRRAFAPITVVVAEEGDQIVIFGVNDTPHDRKLLLRHGIVPTLSSDWLLDQTAPVTLSANASTPLTTFPRARMKDPGTCAAVAMLSDADGTLIAQHRLFLRKFKDLQFAQPEIVIEQHTDHIILQTDRLAWGVCLDIDGERMLADNAFDLLPGVPRRMPWEPGLGIPTVFRTGNSLSVGK